MGQSYSVDDSNSNQKMSMSTNETSVFKDPEVTETQSTIHDKYVVALVDKAHNTIGLICKKHYIDCLKI